LHAKAQDSKPTLRQTPTASPSRNGRNSGSEHCSACTNNDGPSIKHPLDASSTSTESIYAGIFNFFFVPDVAIGIVVPVTQHKYPIKYPIFMLAVDKTNRFVLAVDICAKVTYIQKLFSLRKNK